MGSRLPTTLRTAEQWRVPSRCSFCEALYQEPPVTESLPSVPALPSSFLRRKQAVVPGLCSEVGAAAAPPGKTVGQWTVWVLSLLGSRQADRELETESVSSL